MTKRPWLPSKGPKSPFSAGSRTILARTCTKCGQLADGDSFPLINQGKGGRRRVCHNCQNAQKKLDREQRGIGLPAPRPPEVLQTSKYELWTDKDLDHLKDAYAQGYSYEDIALALGRSARAVFQRRVKLGLPRQRKQHRVEKPWKIQ